MRTTMCFYWGESFLVERTYLVLWQRNVAVKWLRPILGGSTQYGRSWEPILSGNKEIAFQQFIMAVPPITCGCWLLSCHLSLWQPQLITCGCLASSLVIDNWRQSGWPIRQVPEKDSERFSKNGPTKSTQFLRYQFILQSVMLDILLYFAILTPSKLYRS